MNSSSNKRPAIPNNMILNEMIDIGEQLCLGDLKNAIRQFHNLIRDLSAHKRGRGRRPVRNRLTNRPPTA